MPRREMNASNETAKMADSSRDPIALLQPSLKAATKTARASLDLGRDISMALLASVEAQQRAHMEAHAQTVQLCRDLNADLAKDAKSATKPSKS